MYLKYIFCVISFTDVEILNQKALLAYGNVDLQNLFVTSEL